jgi:hypothetical protein
MIQSCREKIDCLPLVLGSRKALSYEQVPASKAESPKLQEEATKLNAWSFCVFIGNG